MGAANAPGTVGWLDLTVDDAEQVRDFYEAVVGWKMTPVSQGDYDDFCATPQSSDDPIAGICHARGSNSNLPSQWLMYVTVSNLEHSLQECAKLGGAEICPPRDMGAFGTMSVIRDPAGAVMAIIEPAA